MRDARYVQFARLTRHEPAGTLQVDDIKVELAYDYMGRRVRKQVYEWDGSEWDLTADTKFVWAGWLLLCRSKRSFTPRLEAIGAVPGVVIAQAGDSEAAGDAPATAVEELLSVLGAYRRRPPSRGRSADAMRALGRQRRLAGAP